MAKRKEKPSVFRQFSQFAQGDGKPYIMLLAITVGAIIVLVATWHRIAGRVMQAPQYWVGLHNVSITPLPQWIHRNLKTEALRDGGLRFPLPLADPNLCARVAAGFSIHPWVQRVRQVRKYYPGRVDVELEYRRPVCMVHVPGGLLPVDRRGILLPSEDFSPLEAARYPRLEGIDRLPTGPPGQLWGDERVSGAAAIAAALVEDWQQMQLDHIAVKPLPAPFAYQYELVTAAGTRIVWGSAPGTEQPGEPTVSEKLLRLRGFFQEHQSLDLPGPTGALDLRRRWSGKTNPTVCSTDLALQ